MDIAILGSARTTIGAPFAGGLEMHTHVLAQGLVERGHRVTVFAADGDGSFDVSRLRPLARDGSSGRRDLCSSPLAELSELDSYLDAMVRLASARFDVVHLNTVHYLPFACAAMVPGAVTGTLHSPPYPWMVHALRGAAKSIKPLSVASVSRTNARAWSQEVPVGRVVLNGVDLRRWVAGRGGGGAVWTGRIVPEKAPHLAIDAARAAGLALRLFGPVHDDEYFANEVAPRLGDDIELIGHATVDELVTAVGEACVAVVSPTWDEPFGLVVAEALACGTPVAAFDRGALRELLGSRTGVLAVAGDTNALAAAMQRASRLDRDECRRAAEERFCADRMVDDYERWFVETIDARQSEVVEVVEVAGEGGAADGVEVARAGGAARGSLSRVVR